MLASAWVGAPGLGVYCCLLRSELGGSCIARVSAACREMLPARSAVLQHAALCCVICLFVFSARAITIEFDDVTLASCTSTNVTRVTIHAPRVNDTMYVHGNGGVTEQEEEQ